MKRLALCLLTASLLCLCSCSSSSTNLGPNAGPDVTAYLKTLNKEARQEIAPFRYRISADGTAFEKYRAANFDDILHEIDIAEPRQTETNESMQWDILAGIAVSEEERGGELVPTIVEVRPLKRANGIYREAWIIDRKGTIVEYLVTVTPIGGDDVRYKVYPLS